MMPFIYKKWSQAKSSQSQELSGIRAKRVRSGIGCLEKVGGGIRELPTRLQTPLRVEKIWGGVSPRKAFQSPPHLPPLALRLCCQQELPRRSWRPWSERDGAEAYREEWGHPPVKGRDGRKKFTRQRPARNVHSAFAPSASSRRHP